MKKSINQWLCSDRELSLRSKLEAGWSAKSSRFQTTASNCKDEIEKSNVTNQITDYEQEIILDVIQRSRKIDQMEQDRINKLIERLKIMRKNAKGDGNRSCAYCNDEFTFSFFLYSYKICNDCKKYICNKCSVINCSTNQKKLVLCKLCSETREMWRKSGAWFFNSSFPNYCYNLSFILQSNSQKSDTNDKVADTLHRRCSSEQAYYDIINTNKFELSPNKEKQQFLEGQFLLGETSSALKPNQIINENSLKEPEKLTDYSDMNAGSVNYSTTTMNCMANVNNQNTLINNDNKNLKFNDLNYQSNRNNSPIDKQNNAQNTKLIDESKNEITNNQKINGGISYSLSKLINNFNTGLIRKSTNLTSNFNNGNECKTNSNNNIIINNSINNSVSCNQKINYHQQQPSYQKNNNQSNQVNYQKNTNQINHQLCNQQNFNSTNLQNNQLNNSRLSINTDASTPDTVIYNSIGSIQNSRINLASLNQASSLNNSYQQIYNQNNGIKINNNNLAPNNQNLFYYSVPTTPSNPNQLLNQHSNLTVNQQYHHTNPFIQTNSFYQQQTNYQQTNYLNQNQLKANSNLVNSLCSPIKTNKNNPFLNRNLQQLNYVNNNVINLMPNNISNVMSTSLNVPNNNLITSNQLNNYKTNYIKPSTSNLNLPNNLVNNLVDNQLMTSINQTNNQTIQKKFTNSNYLIVDKNKYLN